MIRKKALFISAALVLFATAVFADVTVTDTGAKEGPVPNQSFKKVDRRVTFNNNGPVPYSLYYIYINDPELLKVNPKVSLPCIGDPSAGTTGMGLDYPWYRSGFLGININSKPLTTVLASDFKIVEQGKRGVYDVTWAPEWANIRARFISMPNDDKLYLEVSVDPKVQVTSPIKLRFDCIPGYLVKNKDQWISTAERSVQHGPDMAVLNLKKEPWIFYYDTLSSINGTCALFYLPEEANAVNVIMNSNNTDATDIYYPASARKMHFVLCNFPEKYKSREEAFKFLKENGDDILSGLKKMDFGK